MVSEYYGGAHRVDYLNGDVYPSNFSFRDPQLNHDLYVLWNRNEFVQLLIDWMPFEAFRRGIQFIEDEGEIKGFKHGKPYVFKGYKYKDPNNGKTYTMTGFEEYIMWNDIMIEWIFAVSLSRLYPEGSLLVFLDDIKDLMPITEQGKTYIRWGANPNPQGYFKFKVFQPMNVNLGTGFSVYDSDKAGNVTKWKIYHQTENMKKGKTFIVDDGRCIHLQWKKKDNSWLASSRVQGMARIAQLENQIFEKLNKRAHDVAGGILEMTGVASETEQQTLDAAIGSDLTSVDRVYLQEGRTIEYKTPDLKAAGEFASIFEMFSKKLCRHMRVSQLILDGEHTGAGLGGNNNVEMMNSFSEVYQIQEHYRSKLEEVFFKLGKNNTTFIYNEILPEDLNPEEKAVSPDGKTDSNTTPKNEEGKDNGKENPNNKSE